MHILYLTEYFHTPAEGGLMRTWELSRFLVDRGHRVSVVVPSPHHMTGELDERTKGILWSTRMIGGIKVTKTYAYSGFRRGYLGRLLYYVTTPLLALFRSLGEDPDVIIGSSPPFFLAPGAFLLSRIKRVPFVLEVRDAWLEFAISKGFVPAPLVSLFEREQRWLWKHSDRIVAVTPGIRSMIQQVLGNDGADKILLIMNGFEEDIFAKADLTKAEQIRQKYGLKSKFVVIYAGTMGLARDCLVFVRAAALLRGYVDIIFVFLGDGERKIEMSRFVKENELKNCIFVPMQPRIDIPAWLTLSSVGLNSIRAGEALESSLSNKIFDYLGSGLPVVFSGGGDTKDFLERCGGGLVMPAEDAQAMADAILMLYKDPGLRSQMGSRGRAFVLRHYSRSKLLEPLEKALTSLVN